MFNGLFVSLFRFCVVLFCCCVLTFVLCLFVLFCICGLRVLLLRLCFLFVVVFVFACLYLRQQRCRRLSTMAPEPHGNELMDLTHRRIRKIASRLPSEYLAIVNSWTVHACTNWLGQKWLQCRKLNIYYHIRK